MESGRDLGYTLMKTSEVEKSKQADGVQKGM